MCSQTLRSFLQGFQSYSTTAFCSLVWTPHSRTRADGRHSHSERTRVCHLTLHSLRSARFSPGNYQVMIWRKAEQKSQCG